MGDKISVVVCGRKPRSNTKARAAWKVASRAGLKRYQRFVMRDNRMVFLVDKSCGSSVLKLFARNAIPEKKSCKKPGDAGIFLGEIVSILRAGNERVRWALLNNLIKKKGLTPEDQKRIVGAVFRCIKHDRSRVNLLKSLIAHPMFSQRAKKAIQDNLWRFHEGRVRDEIKLLLKPKTAKPDTACYGS